MTRVGFILSGCGFMDGSEIHESVVAMLALEEAGAKLRMLAPSIPQTKVTDHLTGKETDQKRQVLTESARIARGKVEELGTVTPDDFDAIVMPGGFGAALNLCNFATEGENMTVNKELERLLLGMHEAKKPIGAICIAPVILAKLFGSQNARITIGTDQETADKLKQLGADHMLCKVHNCVVDEKNLLVTTPAYMLAESVKDIHAGIRKLVDEVIRLAKKGN